MADELWNTLLKFHREVALPDYQRLFRDLFTPFRKEMQLNFDEMHRRFDKLDALNREIGATLRGSK
jgi:hypothetical protein